MTSREAYLKTRARLAGVTSEAAFEARLIIAAVTGGEPARAALSERELSEKDLELIEKMTERRLRREPLQYILGEWSFMGLDFFVTPAALIPRQDTELICETALRLIREKGYGSALDICTGTGCIAIAIKKLAGREIAVEAADISAEALELARRNAEKNEAEIFFRQADLFEGAGEYDLITANPPYVSSADMQALQPELAFEPRLALYGGEDGLDIYRRIAKEYGPHLKSGGALLMEVGAGEAEAVSALFEGARTRIIKDLNGIERVVEIIKNA